MKKQITKEQIKTLQMDVLSAVDEFCKNYGIRYSMACGTLLGAVRHKGYIPWDDDIDIYMLRGDYNIFVQNFPNLYKGCYCLASLNNTSYWDRPYAKVYDDRTLLIENATCSRNIGVNIDIFPIDEVPDKEVQWKKFNSKRRLLIQLFLVKTIKLRKNRPLKKNIYLAVMHTLLFPFSRRFISLLVERYITRNNGRGYRDVFECSLGLLLKHKFPKSLFDDLIYLQFEERYFMSFRDYDTYLKNAYGLYMQLPPVEKRITHHSYSAYWKDDNRHEYNDDKA